MTAIRTLDGSQVEEESVIVQRLAKQHNISEWEVEQRRRIDKSIEDAVLMCFWCREPIPLGDLRENHVKPSFCHSSHWEKGEYGYIDDTGVGHLYSCKACDGGEIEGYGYCEKCNLLFNDDDLVFEEDGIFCRECWLEERGFGADQTYKSIDAWRGHNSAEAKGNTVKAVECCVIGHKDNEAIMSITEDWLTQNGYEHIHYTEHTSNVFSVNLIILAKRKGDKPLREMDFKKLKALDDAFVEVYTNGFSIMSGKTYPMDLKGYKERLGEIGVA